MSCRSLSLDCRAEWLESGDVEFSDTQGLIGGLKVLMGDKITYMASIDLMSTTFDADSDDADDIDDLDITALGIQFGVRGQF